MENTMEKKLILSSLRNAMGTTVYVALVAFIILNGQKIFGTMRNIIGPIAFLLLFVTSAAITGFMVLGQPVILYIDNKRQEALKLFILTVVWLLLFTVITLALNLI
jgi:hypothetical protein